MRKPGTSGLVICETVAAISTHYRLLSPEFPFKPGGHHPRPSTFCAKAVGWDTELPTTRPDGSLAVKCRECHAVATSMRARGELP